MTDPRIFAVFRLAALVLVATPTSVGPGLWLLRRVRMRPLERLCAAIAISHVVLYLLAFGAFLARVPILGSTLFCLGLSSALLVAARKEWRRVWRDRRSRQALGWLAVVCGVLLLLLSAARNFAGGDWYGDWYEHYERVALFHDGGDPRALLLEGTTQLPARPPFMNIVAAALLGLTKADFASFQVAFLFLNALSFLPACLLLRDFAPRARNGASLLALLAIANPMFVWNNVYTWTKLGSAFYVNLGLALYLAAWRRKRSDLMVLAFLVLAAGIVVHYSAAPFALALGLHYLFRLLARRPRPLRELALIASSCAALLLTWFLYALVTHGTRGTFFSNSSAQGYQASSPGTTFSRIGTNLVATLLPYPLHHPHAFDRLGARALLPQLRDQWFFMYQTCFGAAFGVIGWLPVAYLVGLAWSGAARRDRARRGFFIWYLCFTFVLGVVTLGKPYIFGVAHICTQPLVLMGLALAASRFDRLPRVLALAVLIGALFDFGAGTLLHSYVGTLVPQLEVGPQGTLVIDVDGLGPKAVENFKLKVRRGVTFLGDRTAPFGTVLLAMASLAFLILLATQARALQDPSRAHSSTRR